MKHLSFFLAAISLFGFFMSAGEVSAYACKYVVQGNERCHEIPETDDPVTAAEASDICANTCSEETCDSGFEVIDSCGQREVTVPTTNLDPPLQFTGKEIPVVLGRSLQVIIGSIGALTFLVFAYGGFLWLTSGGNEDRIKTGTQAMLWSVIGILVILAATSSSGHSLPG